MPSRTGKIQSAWTATGSTLYAIVRNTIAEAWNVGGATFQAFNVANWSQYAVPMTEQGALSQFYVADLPAGAESYYTVAVYEQVGVGPAAGDTLVDVFRAAQLADDVPHGGVLGIGTATLALEQMQVVNATGDAALIKSSNGYALRLIQDGGTFGAALEVSTQSQLGVWVHADTSGTPFEVDAGDGTAAAVGIYGGNGGVQPALKIGANAIGCPAVLLTAKDADVVAINPTLVAAPGARAVFVAGAGTSPAVQFGDGTNGASGLLIQAGPNDHAVHIIGGNTAGDGVFIESLEKGLEINATGGGIIIQSDGTGISVQSATDTAVFLGSSLLPTVTLFAAIGNAVEVNSQQSVDFRGRHRILSSLTIGEDLLAFPFIMTDLAGNPKTGLTVTSTVSLDGAAAVPTTNAPTEIGDGQYSIDLTASDRAGTTMMLRFTAPNARDLDIALINTA